MANRGYSSLNIKKWWSVEKYDTGASSWVSDSSIPSPSVNSLSQNKISTAQMVTKADGGLGRISGETTTTFDQIKFLFYRNTVSTNLINQFNTYMDDNTGVRLTTHVSGVKFEGYVDAVNRVWPFTGDTQEFDIEVAFQQFDVDGSGQIND